MKTCETCICWRKIGYAHAPRRIVRDTGVTIVPAGNEGECRRVGPIADHQWPLTGQGDWCAAWRTNEPAEEPHVHVEHQAMLSTIDALASLQVDLRMKPVELSAEETVAVVKAAAEKNLGAGSNGVASSGSGTPPVPSPDDTDHRRRKRGPRGG